MLIIAQCRIENINFFQSFNNFRIKNKDPLGSESDYLLLWGGRGGNGIGEGICVTHCNEGFISPAGLRITGCLFYYYFSLYLSVSLKYFIKKLA